VPQANDAELTVLYTASTGLDVLDNEPNTGAPGVGALANFELQLEGVAGNVIGNGGADYVLTITCIDDTAAAPNVNLDPAGNPFNQSFVAGTWVGGGAAGNFRTKQTFLINVPAGVRGHVFHYEGRLVSNNNDLNSFVKSNPFILV
jgi:hypothetical protein